MEMKYCRVPFSSAPHELQRQRCHLLPIRLETPFAVQQGGGWVKRLLLRKPPTLGLCIIILGEAVTRELVPVERDQNTFH